MLGFGCGKRTVDFNLSLFYCGQKLLWWTCILAWCNELTGDHQPRSGAFYHTLALGPTYHSKYSATFPVESIPQTMYSKRPTHATEQMSSALKPIKPPYMDRLPFAKKTPEQCGIEAWIVQLTGVRPLMTSANQWPTASFSSEANDGITQIPVI